MIFDTVCCDKQIIVQFGCTAKTVWLSTSFFFSTGRKRVACPANLIFTVVNARHPFYFRLPVTHTRFYKIIESDGRRFEIDAIL